MTDQLIERLRCASGHDSDLFAQAADRLEALTAPSVNDFARFQAATAAKKAASNDYCAAGVRLELAHIRERIAELMSQAEPLNSLDIDREKVRQVLHYVACGRLKP